MLQCAGAQQGQGYQGRGQSFEVLQSARISCVQRGAEGAAIPPPCRTLGGRDGASRSSRRVHLVSSLSCLCTNFIPSSFPYKASVFLGGLREIEENLIQQIVEGGKSGKYEDKGCRSIPGGRYELLLPSPTMSKDFRAVVELDKKGSHLKFIEAKLDERCEEGAVFRKLMELLTLFCEAAAAVAPLHKKLLGNFSVIVDPGDVGMAQPWHVDLDLPYTLQAAVVLTDGCKTTEVVNAIFLFLICWFFSFLLLFQCQLTIPFCFFSSQVHNHWVHAATVPEKALGKMAKGEVDRKDKFLALLSAVGWTETAFPQGVGPYLPLLQTDADLDEGEIFGGDACGRGHVTLVPGSMAHRGPAHPGPEVGKDESEGKQEKEKDESEGKQEKEKEKGKARAVLFFTATPLDSPCYSK